MLWLLALGLAGLAYLYLSHVYSYWSRKGLPQPTPVWGFGNLLDAFLMRRSPGRIYTDIYRTYPEHSAVGMYDCTTPKLLLRSPELIQRVLVSDFSSFHDNEFSADKHNDPYFYHDPFCLKGDEWKPSRMKTASTMTAVRIKEVFPLMKEIIPRLNSYVDSNIGKEMKAKDLTQLFMMDNVSNIVFGIDSNCFSDPKAAFRILADIQMKEQMQTWWKTVVYTCLPTARDFFKLKFVPNAVSDYVRSLMQEIYNMRTEKNIKRGDLFQYFMSKENGHDIEELMNYGMLFFIEGFETSAMTASGIIYELAVNPEIQQALYEEICSALGAGEVPDLDTISSLHYMDMVVKEAMRKYPVMYTYIRKCTKRTTLNIDDKDVVIEPETPVVVPVFALHRDPQHYPDPERFYPERFSEENTSTRPPYTYLPFGEGPRICPGMRFGLAQVKLMISNLVYKYRILSTEKTAKTLSFQAGSILVVPNDEDWIKLEIRH